MSSFPFTLIDLTHSLTPSIPSWDGSCGFSVSTLLEYADCDAEVKFKVQDLSLHAGMGTHMDAPAHCMPSGKTVDQISLNDCLAPCVVIDVEAIADEYFLLSKKDIEQFEQQHGRINAGTFIIVRTGWDKYWSNPSQYRNDLQFPSISIEAAQYLLKRDIIGLGIDTLSPDTAESGFPVHKVLLERGKYIIENIAFADRMPPVGGYTLIAPLLIADGTEAPVRLIGLVPHQHSKEK